MKERVTKLVDTHEEKKEQDNKIQKRHKLRH